MLPVPQMGAGGETVAGAETADPALETFFFGLGFGMLKWGFGCRAYVLGFGLYL